MSIELPLLRLGLAGFSADQQEQAVGVLRQAGPAHVGWQVSSFPDADAWWLSGARSQMVQDGILRVNPGAPTARALQLNLAEVDRPMAFTLPVSSSHFDRATKFDLSDTAATQAVLAKFTRRLQSLVTQFGLASCLVDHYSSLGPGVFEVVLDGRLLAVVNMRGEVAVRAGVLPTEFSDAMWVRRTATTPAPADFLQATLSQLMWQFALRTRRDLLPAHYRTGMVYFRRPPKLSQRLLKDAHLLLLRELATAPATFDELAQRTGLVGTQLAQPLAALYYVGSITSNPKRACEGSLRRVSESDSQQVSDLPSHMDTRPPTPPRRPIQPSDLTAPAPLLFR